MNAAAEQITGFTFEEIYDYTFHASVHSCRPNGDPYPLHECPVFRHQQEGTDAQNESEIFVSTLFDPSLFAWISDGSGATVLLCPSRSIGSVRSRIIRPIT